MTSAKTLVVRSRLAHAGIELPEVAPPVRKYVPLRRYGPIAFCAGVTSDGVKGTSGLDATVEDGKRGAALAACRALAYIEDELGSLDRVADILRVTGYVACLPSFHEVPVVIDAASEIFLSAFGNAGRHARSAIGVASLPVGALVEIEVVLSLNDAAEAL